MMEYNYILAAISVVEFVAIAGLLIHLSQEKTNNIDNKHKIDEMNWRLARLKQESEEYLQRINQLTKPGSFKK
jgi:uncharacterized protein YoxC